MPPSRRSVDSLNTHRGPRQEAWQDLRIIPTCIFRGKAAGDSWGKRPLIPEQAGHRFHGKPAASDNAEG